MRLKVSAGAGRANRPARYAGLLCILLTLLCLAHTPPSEAQTRKSREKVSPQKLRTDLSKVKAKESQARRELRNTRRQVRAVRTDITVLDRDLDRLTSRLADTTQRLTQSRTRQQQVADALKVATHQAQAKREQVRRRLRWMYVNGNPSVVTALMDSNSVADVASRAYLMQRVARADRQLFAEYQALQSRIADHKREADELVVRVATLKRNQEAEQDELSDTKAEKEQALRGLRAKQADLERLVRQLDAEERAIAARIAAYMRRTQGSSAQLPAFRGRFIRPVSGPITSGYGMRFHPILRRNRLHTGLDFGGRTGSPIRATADGIVIAATYMGGYGNTVILDHGGGISTLYGHCSRLYVREGQRVRQGEVIAAIGSTGLSTGPHLHWEIRVNGRPVNPSGRF